MNEATHQRGISTRELAGQAGVTPEGIRVQLCRAGHYYGLRPQRLPNGRLLWPSDSLDRLLEVGRRTKPRTPPGPKSRQASDCQGVAQ